MAAPTVIEICPLLDDSMLEEHVLDFLRLNPEGVRNCDVARAIGVSDPKQWLSYSLLQRLTERGAVVKQGRLYYIPQAAAA